MKSLLLTGTILVLALLMTGLATPILAHGPDVDTVTPGDNEAWGEMHQACESGDWEAMEEAAWKVHGEDFSDMPYHDENGNTSANHWGSMDGHMGRGGMGGYMGGYMGGGMMSW